MSTIAVTDAIKSFTDVEVKFSLSRSSSPDFFLEWQNDFDELTSVEKATLDPTFSRSNVK